MLKFTPGPWKIISFITWNYDEPKQAIVSGNTDELGLPEYLFSEPGVEPDGSWCTAHESEVPGNMRLASKAPEMYEALETACKWCSMCNHAECAKCKVKTVLNELEDV